MRFNSVCDCASEERELDEVINSCINGASTLSAVHSEVDRRRRRVS